MTKQRHATVATPYAACYMFLRRGNKIAFLLRSHTGWMDGMYGLPAGRVEKGERISFATTREVVEEVGVTVRETDMKHALTIHRRADEDKTFWVDVYFEITVWKGEPYNAEPHKHSELVWLNPDDLPENIIPAVRFALEQFKAGKTYAEFGWD